MYLYCYDISDSRQRAKIAKELEKFGIRIQKSFFQCDVPVELALKIRDTLAGMIDKKTDSLMMQPICSDCLNKVRLMGDSNILKDVTFEIL